MRRGLIFSLIALAVFIASSAGANVQLLSSETQAVKKSKARKISSIAPDSYRSPARTRKVVVGSDNLRALAEARAYGATEIADYGSFVLFAMDDDQLASAQVNTQSQSGQSPNELPLHTFVVRDDFNVVMLRSGAIDTTAEDAPGSLVGFQTASAKELAQANAVSRSKVSSPDLRLIQFVGPAKSAWLDELRASGLEVIAYVPNNAYLVRGVESARSQFMRAASTGGAFVQWEGPFADEYKIHPALSQIMSEEPESEQMVAIQIARRQGERESADTKAAQRMAASLIGEAYQVLNFTNVRMKIVASRISELAALSNVVNIEPWTPPSPMDENADQVIAGSLTADGKQVSGPGYMQWLAAHGFNSRFNFAIDVSDTGLDRGSIAVNQLHPDFLDASGQSRVLYVKDYTSELDGGDVPGHGTLNLSIAGGGNVSSASGMKDASGYNYGLGIAPFVLLGSSKIFQSTNRFDLVEPYTTLISQAYTSGARVSSNSWVSATNSYTIDSQEYDSRARDAVPAQAGNQEIIILFAAGNSGFIQNIGSPGSAKNVVSVGASESSRKDGADGCLVRDADADSVLDIASFSSGGPLDDGRIKPDISAPGTHIVGAASQHPDFDGTGVCGSPTDLYFPAGQKLYTWSSGTSHSTPIVAGAAALARQYFINQGGEPFASLSNPSAALIKALLLNTTTYMNGALAGGNLPQARQGWGLLNLNRAFDSTPKIFINQLQTLTDSGQEFVLTGEVKDQAQPFRVMLAWSDAPGFSGAAPWVNDLDLEVTINGQVYRGNNFKGQESQPGGNPDTKNNVEAVWLPAGTVGTFAVRVLGSSIAGDGVPGNADFSDQDFALVVYNGERKSVPVATLAGVTVSGGADAFADPGETVSLKVGIGNASATAFTGGRGVLTSKTTGVTVTTGAADYPTVATGQSGENLTPFVFTIDRSIQCGSTIEFVLDVTAGGSVSRVPVKIRTGRAQPVELFNDDIESGEAKWTHGSLIKKKKNRVDTWKIVPSKRFRSGSNAWFTPDLGKTTDGNLDSLPIQLPADGRNLQLAFYHTFEFEPGTFDGGVIEISTGGDFEDLGSKILVGAYNGDIPEFITSNPLAGRNAWVEGRMGQLQQVVVDLSSFAGKTVIIRFRVGTDQDVRGLGWYVDDITIKGDRVTCSPVAFEQ